MSGYSTGPVRDLLIQFGRFPDGSPSQLIVAKRLISKIPALLHALADAERRATGASASDRTPALTLTDLPAAQPATSTETHHADA